MQILVKLCLVGVEILALNSRGVFEPSDFASMNPDLLNSGKKQAAIIKHGG